MVLRGILWLVGGPFVVVVLLLLSLMVGMWWYGDIQNAPFLAFPC
jgi:hypothetical protein